MELIYPFGYINLLSKNFYDEQQQLLFNYFSINPNEKTNTYKTMPKKKLFLSLILTF